MLSTTLPDYQDQSSTTKQWQKTFLSHRKFCCQSSDNFFIMVPPPPISFAAAFKAEVLSILFWLYHKTAKYAKALLYSPLFQLEIYSTFYHEHSVIYLWTFPLILMIDMKNIWSKTKCLLLYLIIPLQSRGRALRDVLGISFHWYHDDLACSKFQPWKITPYKNSRVLMAFIHQIWDSPML